MQNGNPHEVLAAQNAVDFLYKTGYVALPQAQSMLRDLKFTEPANRIPHYLLAQPEP